MANKKGQKSSTTRASRGKVALSAGAVSSAYQDLLKEVESSPTQTGGEGKAIKRRRIRGQLVTTDASGCDEAEEPPKPTKARKKDQNSPPSTVNHDTSKARGQTGDGDADSSSDVGHGFGSGFDNSEQRKRSSPLEQTAYKDESSEESDFAWEEVDLAHDQAEISEDQEAGEAGPESESDDQDLDLVLDNPSKSITKQVAINRKRPLTAAERKVRLDVHKVHILCLLSHVHLRNHWCNDQTIHQILYRRLPKSIVSLLNPDESLPDFRQDESFREGLRQFTTFFRSAFTVTARGMSRAYWADNDDPSQSAPPADTDLILSKSDFADHARNLSGSRDFGTQLACALLRAAGVETRLVCSLQ
ncbi:MAG: hypothetical protein Q9222_006264, partial [Ikaeria aurantiellina]